MKPLFDGRQIYKGVYIIDDDHTLLFQTALQALRVVIWSINKSRENLGLTEEQIRALGENYMDRTCFKARIAIFEDQFAGYSLGYKTRISQLNSPNEEVMDGKLLEKFEKVLHKKYGVETMGVMFANGLGVLPQFQKHPTIALSLAEELIRGLRMEAHQNNVNAIFFYTWEGAEHPGVYKRFGFEKVDFSDPAHLNHKYWIKII